MPTGISRNGWGDFMGPQTKLAVQNFPIGTHRLQPEFVQALGLVKACVYQHERQ